MATRGKYNPIDSKKKETIGLRTAAETKRKDLLVKKVRSDSPNL